MTSVSLAAASPDLAAANDGGEGVTIAGTVPFLELEGWASHDARPALAALSRQCRLSPPRAGTADWLPAACARMPVNPSAAAARAFFETHFVAVKMAPGGDGFLTGYFEPELEASDRATERFRVPLRAPPENLVRIDPAELAGGFTHALKRTDGRFEPVPDRAAIEAGALDDVAPPIAFLEDPVDAFFVHIQGSVRLRMTDGTVRRVGYAGKSGHPYTAIGRVLVEEGVLSLDEVTADSIRRVLSADPDAAARIMQRNRSYIFFREKAVGDPALGPVAAAGVQLTPLASVAVDRAHVPWGTPVFLSGPLPIADPDHEAAFATLAIAQDTGSAIVGPARGDLFMGSGPDAGLVAGRIKHPVRMVRLAYRGAQEPSERPSPR